MKFDPLAIYRRFPPRLATLLSPPLATSQLAKLPNVSGRPNSVVQTERGEWERAIIAAAHGTLDGGQPDAPNAMTSEIAQLPLPLLSPPRPPASRDWLLKCLREFIPQELPGVVGDQATATALTAGVLQWHDYLEESHAISQSIEGKGRHRIGDYWHAIMHRREPDYGNARYWFRHVGRQPVFASLAGEAFAILRAAPAPVAARWRDRLCRSDGIDPVAFVDLCESLAGDEESELALAARRIQFAELWLLLEFNWDRLSDRS
ncbi:MAG: hypothetical protein ACT4QC_05780 [Planctomycetaceae bacterium]